MKIYIYRHGETIYNDKGMVQGRGVDSSLNELGKKQAKAFFQQYKELPFERLITSTLKRTIQTAAPFESLNIPVERREELEEISWGIYEGKSADEKMHNAYLNLLSKWSEGDYHAKIEGGDSAWEMQKRLKLFVEDLKQLQHQHVLVCTHGGCMAYLMAILQDQPLSAMPNYKHRNTGLCIFEFHRDADKFELQVQDDISHLERI